MTVIAADPTLTPLRASDHAQFEAAVVELRPRLGANHGLLIGGADLGPHRLRTQHSPTDRGLAIGHFAAATEIEVGLAITAAHAAFPGWANTAESDRRGVVRRVLAQFEARAFELAAVLSLEAGKTRHEALREIWGTTEVITAYCDEWASHGFAPGATAGTRKLVKTVPHGVWTVYSSFHHPLAFGAAPAAAALLAGNTVVLKSAEETSWSARIFAEMIRDAGVPPGVFNLISGAPMDMGDAMLHDDRVAGTTFTGAASAGRPLSQMMWTSQPRRACVAEFISKSARIVTASADVESAAVSIVRDAFGLTGQRPGAPSYLLVHHDIADALVSRLASLSGELIIGDPTLAETEIGPLVSPDDHAHYRQVSRQLHEHGAHVLFGAEMLSERGRGVGHFVALTLAEVSNDGHSCWGKEWLLPLVMMRRFGTPDRALHAIHELKRTTPVRVYGDAAEQARFARALANATEPSDPLAPHGATSAWTSLPATMRAEEAVVPDGAAAVAALHGYLSRYLRDESAPGAA